MWYPEFWTLVNYSLYYIHCKQLTYISAQLEHCSPVLYTYYYTIFLFTMITFSWLCKAFRSICLSSRHKVIKLMPAQHKKHRPTQSREGTVPTWFLKGYLHSFMAGYCFCVPFTYVDFDCWLKYTCVVFVYVHISIQQSHVLPWGLPCTHPHKATTAHHSARYAHALLSTWSCPLWSIY